MIWSNLCFRKITLAAELIGWNGERLEAEDLGITVVRQEAIGAKLEL